MGPPLEVLRHDVTRDPLPEGAFDLVHVRLALVPLLGGRLRNLAALDHEAVHAAIAELSLLEAYTGDDASRVARLRQSVIDHRAHALRILASVAVRRRAWADPNPLFQSRRQ